MSEQPKKNLGGRPTKLTEELVALAEEYLLQWKEDGSVVPTIEGLCLWVGISKETLYKWTNGELSEDVDKKMIEQFIDCARKVKEVKAKLIMNGGLKGEMNSSIGKLLLSNLGYREKSDITTDDKPLPEQKATTIIADERIAKAVQAFEESLRPKRE